MLGQTFSLYNVAGLIDKTRNIYYVPHKSTLYSAIGSRVCDKYLTLFNTVCPSSTGYTNVIISKWSPEDRTLRVEGTIDNFRVSRGQGLALNYCIVTRTVAEGSGERTYYYAFFIDSVRQAGVNTVELVTSVDHFTNFFYLNNEEICTSDYDPFNPVMRNCFVERQHYDRINVTESTIVTPVTISNVSDYLPNTVYKLVVPNFAVNNMVYSENLTLSEGYFNLSVRDITTNQKVDFALPTNCNNIGLHLTTISLRPIRVTADGFTLNGVYYNLPANSYLSMSFTGNLTYQGVLIGEDYEVIFNSTIATINVSKQITPANEELFLNSEESYKYKYQYKDLRLPLSLVGIDINVEVYNSICNILKGIQTKEQFTAYLSGLSANDRKVVAGIFLKFINIKLKENVLAPMLFSTGAQNWGGYNLDILTLDKNDDIATHIIHFIRPMLDIPYEFSNISKDWFNLAIRNTYGGTFAGEIDITESDLVSSGGQRGTSEYIYDMFITKHSPIANKIYAVTITTSGYVKITFEAEVYKPQGNFNTPYYSNWRQFARITSKINTIGFLPQDVDLENYSEATTNTMPTIFSYDSSADRVTYKSDYTDYHAGNLRAGIIICDNDNPDFKFYFPFNYYNVKDNYFEIILQSEPYNFYSLSLYENEIPLNKSRYYQTYLNNLYTVEFSFIQSFAEGYKIGLIPIYTLNNIKLRYYRDALVVTLPSSIPVVSDSLYSYYLQNKAQMRNQYAVNDFNRTLDFAQDLAINSGTNIIAGGLKGGQAGAIAGAVKSGGDLVNDIIDWGQSNKVIEMNQEATMADMGAKPNTIKQAGSDIVYDISSGNLGIHINHYLIDTYSYNNISKLLERSGYLVNRLDSLNVFDRIGFNYIKLNGFDFVEDNIKISNEQSEAIYTIFSAGVTLLHNKDFLHNLGEIGYHNYETKLGGDN